MNENNVKFDPESVARAWNRAADAYAQGQATGRDYYRYEFLGPAQVAVCGDVSGLQILDVGCGAGYFAREMAHRGARVTAIDISSRMIEHAKQQEAMTPLGIEYRVADAGEVDRLFASGSFDAATSCVAVQDMPEVARVLRSVHTVLRPHGRFVASITHPCTDTPYRTWERDEEGQKRWLCLDRYYERRPIEYSWKNWAYDFTTPALHATLEDWFTWILQAGFSVKGFHEPHPTEEALKRRPDLEDAARMPYYVIFDLQRAE